MIGQVSGKWWWTTTVRKQIAVKNILKKTIKTIVVHSKNDYDLYYCENKTYAKYRKENDMSIKDDDKTATCSVLPSSEQEEKQTQS